MAWAGTPCPTSGGFMFDLKRTARQEVHKALRQGKIIKPQICEVCGNDRMKRLLAHHPDYTQPLKVKWVCDQCHWSFAHPDICMKRSIKQKQIRKDKRNKNKV